MLQTMEKPESGDQPTAAPILIAPTRSIFDATSVEDQAVYLHFMQTGSWLKKYHIEWPSVTAPATCERKLLEHFLQTAKVMKKQAQMAADKPVATLVTLEKSTDVRDSNFNTEDAPGFSLKMGN